MDNFDYQSALKYYSPQEILDYSKQNNVPLPAEFHALNAGTSFGSNLPALGGALTTATHLAQPGGMVQPVSTAPVQPVSTNDMAGFANRFLGGVVGAAPLKNVASMATSAVPGAIKDAVSMGGNLVGTAGDLMKFNSGSQPTVDPHTGAAYVTPDQYQTMQDYTNHANQLVATQQKYGFAAPGTNTPTNFSKLQFGDLNAPQMVAQDAKGAAGVASYMVPYGKGINGLGSNFLTKATLPGMTSGLLQGVSQDNATPESIALDTAIGGLGATAVHGVGQLINKTSNATGSSLIQSQYNVPKSMQRATNLPDTVGKLSDYGLNNVNDVAEKAPLISQKLTNLTNNAISDAGPVDTSGMIQVAEDAVNRPGLKPSTQKQFTNFMSKGLTDINGDSMNGADPSKTMDFVRKIEGFSSDLTKGRAPTAVTTEDRILKNAYDTVASELKDRLYTTSGQTAVGGGEGVTSDVMNTSLKDLAQAHQSPDLTAYENAYNSGDTALMDTLAAKNPGDARFAVHQVSPLTYGTPSAQGQSLAGFKPPSAAPPTSVPDLPYKGAGADKVLVDKYLNDDFIQEMRGLNPKVADELAALKDSGTATIADIRKLNSTFVRGSQLANESEFANRMNSTGADKAVKGVGKLFQNPLNLAAIPLSSDTVNAGLGGALRSAGKLATPQTMAVADNLGARLPLLASNIAQNQTPVMSATPDTTTSTQSAIMGGPGPQAAVGTPSLTTNPNLAQPQVTQNTTQPVSNMAQTGANPSLPTPQNNVKPQFQLSDEAKQSIQGIANDTKTTATEKYKSIYAIINGEKKDFEAEQKVNTYTQKRQDQQKIAENVNGSLDDLLKNYTSMNVIQRFNPFDPTRRYVDTEKTLIAQEIERAAVGRVTQSEINLALDKLLTNMDTPETAKAATKAFKNFVSINAGLDLPIDTSTVANQAQ